jgi:hypothetical protein
MLRRKYIILKPISRKAKHCPALEDPIEREYFLMTTKNSTFGMRKEWVVSYLERKIIFIKTSNKRSKKTNLTERLNFPGQLEANLKGLVRFQNIKILDHFSPSVSSQK